MAGNAMHIELNEREHLEQELECTGLGKQVGDIVGDLVSEKDEGRRNVDFITCPETGHVHILSGPTQE